MANATKLPSGNWRVRQYSHTDSNGKKHYESFTAPTKQEAEMLALKFAKNRASSDIYDMTLSDAIEKYILSKTNVLSPSTIRGYRQLQKNYYSEIGKRKVRKLTSSELQFFVSDLATRVSPKTVRNIYGLLTASVALFAPDMVFRVTLPAKNNTTRVSPSDEQIKALFEQASEWLKACIALGAFGGIRRGEIASLKYGDIKGNFVYIHSDMVLDENKQWYYKEIPKTQASVRMVKLPQKVIDMLGTGKDDDFIFDHTPDHISKHFQRLRNKLGLDVRFHDLRHYYASIGAVLGIPDIYMADFGGWRHDSPVLKGVYQGNIQSIADGYSDKLTEHFENMI